MKKGIHTYFVSVLAFVFLSSSALAASFPYHGRSRVGTMAVDSGIGFTLGPDTFLLGIHGDYFLGEHLAVGPMLQLGVSDSIFLLAPTFGVKGIFDIPHSGFARRVKPFIQAGGGFAYATSDAPSGSNDDDISFLLNVGFGTDIYVTRRVSLGNNLLFNIVPTKLFSNRFFFSWQFITFRYHF